MRKVLIAVSGTGGHVYPGIALGEELRSRHDDVEVLFATARGKPAGAWIRRAGFDVREVSLTGFARRPSLSWITFPFVLAAGCFGALTLLLGEGPDLVVGTGGYVSGPFVAFAAALRIPTVLLEQNALPGVATRLGSLVAREVHLAHGAAADRLPRRSRAVVSGNPVRRSVERGDGSRFRAAHALAKDLPLVVVVGGSQGAAALTKASLDAARELGDDPEVVMLVQAGERQAAAALARAEREVPWVRVVSFLDDIGDAYAAADLVVARAGAMTLAELSAAGVPAVLVPYPYAAGDHQTDNARRHAERGAAVVLAQSELSGPRLAGLIGELALDPERLEAMGRAAREGEGVGARERIADACERWLG